MPEERADHHQSTQANQHEQEDHEVGHRCIEQHPLRPLGQVGIRNLLQRRKHREHFALRERQLQLPSGCYETGPSAAEYLPCLEAISKIQRNIRPQFVGVIDNLANQPG